MLTFAEHTMRGVCDELGAELIEFNGETDHIHLLIAPRSKRRATPADKRDGLTPD